MEIETLQEVTRVLERLHADAFRDAKERHEDMNLAIEMNWNDVDCFESNFLQATARSKGIFDCLKAVMEMLELSVYDHS